MTKDRSRILQTTRHNPMKLKEDILGLETNICPVFLIRNVQELEQGVKTQSGSGSKSSLVTSSRILHNLNERIKGLS